MTKRTGQGRDLDSLDVVALIRENVPVLKYLALQKRPRKLPALRAGTFSDSGGSR